MSKSVSPHLEKVKTTAWRKDFISRLDALPGFQEFALKIRTNTEEVVSSAWMPSLNQAALELVASMDRGELTAARQ